ncbi:MAG: hypothetical protein ACKOJF_32710, partial [Planctomycetaceae bacterium]
MLATTYRQFVIDVPAGHMAVLLRKTGTDLPPDAEIALDPGGEPGGQCRADGGRGRAASRPPPPGPRRSDGGLTQRVGLGCWR